MYTQAQKRLVRITLDVECYEDLNLEALDWAQLLDLEGNESVDVTIREVPEYF
jgi:hypothetical protein